MILAAIVAILVGGGVYLIMQRGMLRQILGLTLISHGVNLMILGAGVPVWRGEPLMDETSVADAADPLPQAFVLTAIVISMASTAVMLAMAAVGRDDDTASADDAERAARVFRGLSTVALHTDAEQVAKDAEAKAEAEAEENAEKAEEKKEQPGDAGKRSGREAR